MVSSKDQSILSKLSHFSLGLKEYEAYRIISKTKGITKQQTIEMMSLRERLLREVGKFGSLVTELTGKERIGPLGKGPEYSYDMWAASLAPDFGPKSLNALKICVDYTDRAIGKLDDDIERGIRDKQGNVIEKPQKSSSEPPKAFISHGRESAALNKLEEFLRALGVEPIIVKEQPSLDRTVDDKVNFYLGQADLVVILATCDDEIDSKLHPRQNVIHEIGLAQKTHTGKIIYLLEAGAEFPSNISPKVWERFKQRNMMNAFLCIAKELRAYGMLKAVKPLEEQTP